MVQLIYKYDKCYECGHEGFQWGMLMSIPTRTLNEESGEFTYSDVNIFVCRDCIATILQKLDDMIDKAKNKTAVEVVKPPFRAGRLQ